MRGGQDPDAQLFPDDFAAHRFRKDALDLRPDRRRVEQLSKVERRDYQQPPQNDRAINCIAGGFDPAPPFRRSAHSRQILAPESDPRDAIRRSESNYATRFEAP